MEAQFCLEVKLLYLLNHPNIIKLYGHFSDDYHVFLLMEYVEGGQLMKKLGSDEKYVARVLEPLLEAMEHLHNRDIIHRDIKPENIVLAFDVLFRLLRIPQNCVISGGQQVAPAIACARPSAVLSTTSLLKWKTGRPIHAGSTCGVLACWHTSCWQGKRPLRSRWPNGGRREASAVTAGTGISHTRHRYLPWPRVLCAICWRKIRMSAPVFASVGTISSSANTRCCPVKSTDSFIFDDSSISIHQFNHLMLDGLNPKQSFSGLAWVAEPFRRPRVWFFAIS